MLRVDARDFAGGGILIALGLFVALYAEGHYKLGTPAHMGPGFMPFWLGWILVGFGVVIMVLAVGTGVKVHVLTPPRLNWRSAIAIPASILVFQQSIERFGLVPAAFALTIVAALAQREFRLARTVMLGAFLGLFAWLVFTVLLEMPLPALVIPS
jgi:hypothetical protein